VLLGVNEDSSFVLAAVDGSAVLARCPAAHIKRHLRAGMKNPTVNLTAATNVGPDLLFWRVVAGADGACHDARVFAHGIDTFAEGVQETDLLVGDSAYPNRGLTMSPHRGVGYHRSDYIHREAKGSPRSAKELFNRVQCLLRNCVERGYGVLKGRYRILGRGIQSMDNGFQVEILLGCCILHNYLRIEGGVDNDQDDNLIRVSDEDEQQSGILVGNVDDQLGVQENNYNNQNSNDRLRIRLGEQMWELWRSSRQ
jgi:hypothetical protein